MVRRAAKTDPRVRLVRGTPPPPGWVGKSWACWQLAGAARGGRIDAGADLLAVHGEEHHGLHPHRLDHVEGDGEFAVLIAIAAARFGDMLWPQAERQFFSGERLVARGPR